MNDGFEELEKDTGYDFELNSTDLETLNVNIWFNKLESRLQHCLIKEEMNDGFYQYQMLIGHAEILAISSGKLDETRYKEALEKYEEELKKEHLEEDLHFNMKYAMRKYKLILKALLDIKKSNVTFSA